MNKNNIKGSIILIIAALIWGLAFVAQDMATEFVRPFTLNATRSLVGFFALFILCALNSARKKEKLFLKKERKTTLLAGIICGICLFVAANLQQFGIDMYPAEAPVNAKAGFLTAMYILFVPIFSIFLKKIPGINVIISVLIAIVGIYLLCFSGGFGGFYLGDLVLLCCGVAFSIHILCVDMFGKNIDGIKLSAIQFLVCSILSFILMIVYEKPAVSDIIGAIGPIIYLGIMSSGIAYTLQIIGQKYCTNPTLASISMSFESVFAALGGALYGDILLPRQYIGCIVMFLAIIISQISFKKKKV